jgi:hypothetical protein
MPETENTLHAGNRSRHKETLSLAGVLLVIGCNFAVSSAATAASAFVAAAVVSLEPSLMKPSNWPASLSVH